MADSDEVISSGISGHGTTLTGNDSYGVGELGEIQRISLSGQEAGEIDISTMKSPGKWKEFIAAMKDAKEIQVDLLYEQHQTAAVLLALGGANESWTITFPDDSTFVCDGFLKSVGTAIPMDDKISQTIAIRLSGEPTFTEGSSA